MQLKIVRLGDTIATYKDFEGIERGEISHLICELELIRSELLGLWRDFDDSKTQI